MQTKNKIFSFSLYKEGLKKIRVTGIAVSILVFALNAVIPLVHMISGERVKTVSVQTFAIPMFIILFCAPVFVHAMFSYLNKRTEADFYHAIPETRLCVYCSFTAAVLTWIWGIIIGSTLFTGLLWWIDGYAQFGVSCLFLLPLAYMLMTLFLAGIMVAAMMLTGTTVTNLAMAALFLCFVRAVGIMASSALDEVISVFDITGSLGAFFSLDFSVIYVWFSVLISGNMSEFFTAYPMLIYTFAVSVVLFIAGGWLYNIRRSEMTGQSAPNKALHHLFRCLITLPFALIVTNTVICQVAARNVVAGDVITLSVITLLVYYLYELITTKSWKRMVRSTPFLGFVVLACLLYTGTIAAVRSSVLKNVPQTDDVAAVCVCDDVTSYAVSYETMVTKSVRIADKETVAFVTDKVEEAVQVALGQKNVDSYWCEISVKLYLKNGKCLGRRIKLTTEEYKNFQNMILGCAEYQSAAAEIPAYREITSLSVCYGMYNAEIPLSDGKKDVWTVFEKEYASLSTEQQNEVKYFENDDYAAALSWVLLEAVGSYNGTAFTSTYRITADMPQTLQAVADAARAAGAEELDCAAKSVKDFAAKEGDFSAFGFDVCVMDNEYVTKTGTLQPGSYTMGCNYYGNDEDKLAADAYRQQLAELFSAIAADAALDLDWNAGCAVSLNGWTNNGRDYYSVTVPLVILSDKTMDMLTQLYNALNEEPVIGEVLY